MMEELYQDLANAIIVRAADDYRKALKKLKKDKDDIKAKSTKDECERFFLSEWYMMLTNVDGNWLMKMLRKEMGWT